MSQAIREQIEFALRHNPGLGQVFLVTSVVNSFGYTREDVQRVIGEMINEGKVVRQSELLKWQAE
jgi:transcriptional regulator of nitric oxide reductase